MTLAFIVNEKLLLEVIVDDGYGCVAFKFICISFISCRFALGLSQCCRLVVSYVSSTKIVLRLLGTLTDVLRRLKLLSPCFLASSYFPVIMLLLLVRWLNNSRWIWICCWWSYNTLSCLQDKKSLFYADEMMHARSGCSSTYDVVKCWLTERENVRRYVSAERRVFLVFDARGERNFSSCST